jgi:prevent-host-death family protein
MMMTIDVEAAAVDLSRLIERARAGEEVIITRHSEPLVRLEPIGKPQRKREFGSMKGRLTVPSEFSEPLPDDELDAWEQ